MDTRRSAIVERHPFRYDWKARLPNYECIFAGEGAAVYAAQGEDAWWIVTDEGMFAEIMDGYLEPAEYTEFIATLVKLERYDDQAAWQTAIQRLRDQMPPRDRARNHRNQP